MNFEKKNAAFEQRLNEKPILLSVIVFGICLLVHAFEVLVIKTDETIFAECFINKMFGIVVLFVCLKLFSIKWKDLGFVKEKLLVNWAKGFCLCFITYLLGFIVELIILNNQGTAGHIEFFVTGFSLTGNVVKQTGIGFVLMCIFFNIINVWMEEGVFRGFFIVAVEKKYSMWTALWVSSLLFGFWHLVTPLRSLIEGEMNLPLFLVLSIGYIILSALMGIKWGLLFKMSGTIWIGMADHFFNNCVVTNLLHVVSANGVDEMQIMRVLIGELTSFAIIITYYLVNKKKNIQQ